MLSGNPFQVARISLYRLSPGRIRASDGRPLGRLFREMRVVFRRWNSFYARVIFELFADRLLVVRRENQQKFKPFAARALCSAVVGVCQSAAASGAGGVRGDVLRYSLTDPLGLAPRSLTETVLVVRQQSVSRRRQRRRKTVTDVVAEANSAHATLLYDVYIGDVHDATATRGENRAQSFSTSRNANL